MPKVKNYTRFKVYPVKWEHFTKKAKEAFLNECIVPTDDDGNPVLDSLGYPRFRAKPFKSLESQKELDNAKKWADYNLTNFAAVLGAEPLTLTQRIKKLFISWK